MDEEKDSNVYRVMKYKYLLKDLKNQKFTLVNIKKWEDPYERFLYKQTYVLDDKEYSLEE